MLNVQRIKKKPAVANGRFFITLPVELTQYLEGLAARYDTTKSKVIEELIRSEQQVDDRA